MLLFSLCENWVALSTTPTWLNNLIIVDPPTPGSYHRTQEVAGLDQTILCSKTLRRLGPSLLLLVYSHLFRLDFSSQRQVDEHPNQWMGTQRHEEWSRRCSACNDQEQNTGRVRRDSRQQQLAYLERRESSPNSLLLAREHPGAFKFEQLLVTVVHCSRSQLVMVVSVKMTVSSLSLD